MSNTQQHGAISWSDDSGSGSKDQGSTIGKDQWLRLEEGNNIIRLVTDPFQYLVHKGIKRNGDPGYGKKVSCSKELGSCVLCDQGHKSSPRYYVGVLHEKSNSYKVLDLSWSTLEDIRSFARQEIWNSPLGWSINLIKNSKSPTKYYSVNPQPPRPLTALQEKLRDESVDLEALQKRTEPLSPEAVAKYVAKIVGDGELAPPVLSEKEKARLAEGKSPAAIDTTKAAPKAAAKPSKAAASVSMDDEEDSDIFPNYGETADNA